MRDILTEEELKFLSHQLIDIDDVHDGRFQAAKVRRKSAEEAGKTFILRDPSRSKCGHRLVTRAGHCIQCDRKRISFARRYHATNFIYIVASKRERFLKIGVTSGLERRLFNLNTQNYGGCRDWEYLYHAQIENAGVIESQAQAAVQDFTVLSRPTTRAGITEFSREIFKCSFESALDAVRGAMEKNSITIPVSEWVAPHSSDY
jgi:hypothetical protein